MDPHEVVARYTQPSDPYRAMYAERPPVWLDELDLKPAPPRHRMGTHALDLDDWLVTDGLSAGELALRHRLLDERRADVFAVLPTAEAASRETREAVQSWLTARGMGAVDGPVPDEHPLAAAGRLVQEDLCLMVRPDGAWHLDGAVLCFPSMWRLGDKIGRPAAAIHGPVAGYQEELAVRVDRFLDRLEVTKPVWRRNLSLKTTHALHLPLTGEQMARGPVDGNDDDGSTGWLRSERQTLRKLPASGAILFTIRTQLAPVSVLQHRPDRALDLVAAYRSRGSTDPIVDWIDRMATQRDTSEQGDDHIGPSDPPR